MLLDPEYGLPATKALDEKAGLLLAYEKQVMTQQAQNACLTAWMFGLQNVLKKKADAVKFLLYYDVDSSDELNQEKQAYIERIGSECVAEDIPFFLEILAYDEKIAGRRFCRIRESKTTQGYWCYGKSSAPTL